MFVYFCELVCLMFIFFFSSRRRHTRCALVTGVQTCALPITATVLLLGLHRALLRWHRFEIKARASAEMMRTVAATLPDALVMLDADGRIRFANGQARAVLGVKRAKLIGNTYDAPEWAITDADGGQIGRAHV